MNNPIELCYNTYLQILVKKYGIKWEKISQLTLKLYFYAKYERFYLYL